MASIIDTALAVAQAGIPVFPTQNKLPAWSNSELGVATGEGGFKQATCDPEKIRRLFAHPKADEIAVPTGSVSNLLCIDADIYKKGANSWVTEHRDLLQLGRVHTSRRGGIHYLFQHPKGVKLPAQAAPGIDIKTDGGYICWPGTPGYDCLKDIPPPHIPPELLREIAGEKKAGAPQGTSLVAAAGDLEGAIKSATSMYPSLRALALSLANFSVPYGDIQNYLRGLMDQSVAANAGHPRHRDWAIRRKAIPQLVASAVHKTANEKPTREEYPPPEPIRAVPTACRRDCVTDPIRWVLPGVFPKGSTCGLAGASSVGKTRWLTCLAICAAAGDYQQLGLANYAEPTSVVWVANEERVSDLRRRILAFSTAHDFDNWEPIHLVGKESGGIKIARTRYSNVQLVQSRLDELAELITQAKASMLILDPYVSLAAGVNENSAESVAVLRDAFNFLSQETGVLIVFAHHTPKRESSKNPSWYSGMETAFRGSSDIYAQLDVGFTLAPWFPPKEEEESHDLWQKNYRSEGLSRFIELTPVKMREGILPPSVVYEIVTQEIENGDSIGYCRLSSERNAYGALELVKDKDVLLLTVASALLDRFGVGVHSGASAIYEAIRSIHGVPSASRNSKGYVHVRSGLARLFEDLRNPVRVRMHDVALREVGGKWEVQIAPI